MQIIRFTGTITQSLWLSGREAVAQVCLNHSSWVGGALTPTGCFDPIGSRLPSAADPRQMCCYGAEEASRRPPTGRESQSAGADVFIVTHVLFPATASGDASQSHSRIRDGSELRGKAAITQIAIKSLRYLEGSYCRLSEILN